MTLFKRNIPIFTIIGFAVVLWIMPMSAQNIDDVTNVAPVFWFTIENASVIDGSEAVLNRMEHGISMSLETNELVPGDVYTGWWVIFNAPENCSDADCLLDDIFLMDGHEFLLDEDGVKQPNRMGRQTTDVTQIRAGSAVADENGHAIFRAHLPIGDMTDNVSYGNGLSNVMGSEIHIVLRTHGPASEDPEIFWEQHMTDWGGCPNPQDRLPCKNYQFATFKPIN
jgi:hypothetical protein